MAVVCRERREAVRLHVWNPARCIGGCVTALALLVPDVYEMISDGRRPPLPWLSVAVAITALACVRWTTLKSDRRTGSLRWRRLAIWGTSHFQFDGGAGVAGQLTVWRTHGIIQRVILRLRRGESTVTVPLGWTWRGRLPTEWRRALVTFAVKANVSLPPELAAKEAPTPRFQVSLRRILLATAGVAVCLGLYAQRPNSNGDLAPACALGAFLLLGAALFYRPASAATERFSLCLTMIYAPFAWLVFFRDLWSSNLDRLFLMALFLPSNYFAGLWVAFIPAFRSHGWVEWGSAVAVMLELAVGLWCARRGWKWTVPYACLVGILSFTSSFILQALLRM